MPITASGPIAGPPSRLSYRAQPSQADQLHVKNAAAAPFANPTSRPATALSAAPWGLTSGHQASTGLHPEQLHHQAAGMHPSRRQSPALDISCHNPSWQFLGQQHQHQEQSTVLSDCIPMSHQALCQPPQDQLSRPHTSHVPLTALPAFVQYQQLPAQHSAALAASDCRPASRLQVNMPISMHKPAPSFPTARNVRPRQSHAFGNVSRSGSLATDPILLDHLQLFPASVASPHETALGPNTGVAQQPWQAQAPASTPDRQQHMHLPSVAQRCAAPHSLQAGFAQHEQVLCATTPALLPRHPLQSTVAFPMRVSVQPAQQQQQQSTQCSPVAAPSFMSLPQATAITFQHVGCASPGSVHGQRNSTTGEHLRSTAAAQPKHSAALLRKRLFHNPGAWQQLTAPVLI